jgi:hypothetical protein
MGRRFGRRAFLRFISAGSLSALGGWGRLTRTRGVEAMDRNLLDSIEASDVAGASALLARSIKEGIDPWEIHLSLFPVVQRVLNPPFINPHLPKMYRVCRDLVPYLSQDRIAALVSLEVSEYARRPKMEKIRRENALPSPATFQDIEMAIKENDPGKACVLMAAFLEQKGGTEFARCLLLLGSGYLNNSLGHSVSCTAFILAEMLERTEQDPWPALSVLASYFCKGRFHTTSVPKTIAPTLPKAMPGINLLRATSGLGFVNLHHTITWYAIERVRKLLTQENYSQMANAWIRFLGEKQEEKVTLKGGEAEVVEDYDQFYKMFSELKAGPVAASSIRMIASEEGRYKLGHFLIQGLCDKYQGSYDPHYLTGLGSTLWILEHYWKDTPIATNALYQYLDFFFSRLK